MSTTDVPTTASAHPETWKFGFPIYHPADLAAWRSWLVANHDHERGVWVVGWRKASGRTRAPNTGVSASRERTARSAGSQARPTET